MVWYLCTVRMLFLLFQLFQQSSIQIKISHFLYTGKYTYALAIEFFTIGHTETAVVQSQETNLVDDIYHNQPS